MTRIRIDIDSNFGQVAETIQNLSSGPVPPPPGHRYGRDCPQCRGWTWKMTQWCVHCGADLFAIDARERARRGFVRNMIALLVVMALGWGMLYGNRFLPESVRVPALSMGMLSMLAGLVFIRG